MRNGKVNSRLMSCIRSPSFTDGNSTMREREGTCRTEYKFLLNQCEKLDAHIDQ